VDVTIFEAIVLGGVSLSAALVIWFTLRMGISPMPSSGRAQRAVLDLIGDNLEGIVYELGSGWGGLAVSIARRHPKARVLAIEASPVPWLYSAAVSLALRLPNLRFLRADFFSCSLADASVVVCYLYPGGMERLATKLEIELAPGTVVVSNTFRVPGWEPERYVELEDMHRTRIYLYRVGPDAPGRHET
jgi:hypothetical protein